MTKEEFATEMEKLIEVYPQQFPEARNKFIYGEVKDCEAKWWADTVKRIILMGNPRLDISESARTHRLAKNAEENTRAMIEAGDAFDHEASKRGLSDVLKKLGAKSLLEAISKRRETV
jgi:predicted aconitase